jgi:hypothetical protein
MSVVYCLKSPVGFEEACAMIETQFRGNWLPRDGAILVTSKPIGCRYDHLTDYTRQVAPGA